MPTRPEKAKPAGAVPAGLNLDNERIATVHASTSKRGRVEEFSVVSAAELDTSLRAGLSVLDRLDNPTPVTVRVQWDKPGHALATVSRRIDDCTVKTERWLSPHGFWDPRPHGAKRAAAAAALPILTSPATALAAGWRRIDGEPVEV
jgi:hypothetical protein